MRWRQRLAAVGLYTGLLVIGLTPSVFAQSTSSNYKVEEYFFGTGGELNACSGSYCSKQSAGELGVGNAASPNYQIQGGYNTSDEPVLEVNVVGGTFDLGVLDSATTFSTSTTFSVRNYLSSGYAVRLAGSALTENSGGHELTPMATAAAASAGTEQFGLGFNTASSEHSFSSLTAATGYDEANGNINPTIAAKFNYSTASVTTPVTLATASGIIACDTGDVRYIGNIATNTPAGIYTTTVTYIAVPTY